MARPCLVLALGLAGCVGGGTVVAQAPTSLEKSRPSPVLSAPDRGEAYAVVAAAFVPTRPREVELQVLLAGSRHSWSEPGHWLVHLEDERGNELWPEAKRVILDRSERVREVLLSYRVRLPDYVPRRLVAVVSSEDADMHFVWPVK